MQYFVIHVCCNYDWVEFPVQEKDFNKIEKKNNIWINIFGYENNPVFPIYISDQKVDGIFCLHILTDLCFTKQKIKTENSFAKVVYGVLGVKMY